MKTCPNCRMESRADADWCWHCGYSYEEAEARMPWPQGPEGSRAGIPADPAARTTQRRRRGPH